MAIKLVVFCYPRLCCTISAIGRAATFEGFFLRDRVREGDSERCEAIEGGNPEMTFGNLAIEIASAQALFQ